MIDLDLRNVMDSDDCDNVKKVASKIGTEVVCDDDDVEPEKASPNTYDFSEVEDCENINEIATKHIGVQVVCDDED